MASTRGAQTEKKVEDRDEIAIAEHVNKKMRLEVQLKIAEMKSLKAQKQAAVDQVTQISTELEVVHGLIEKKKKLLKQSKMEEESFRAKVETFNTEIQVLQQKRDDALKLKAEKVEIAKGHQAAIDKGEKAGQILERRLEKMKLTVRRFEEEIAVLPSAPGYSKDLASLLDEQIAAKRSELVCPVCFEQCAPPIFSCIAQHLVCGRCRHSFSCQLNTR